VLVVGGAVVVLSCLISVTTWLVSRDLRNELASSREAIANLPQLEREIADKRATRLALDTLGQAAVDKLPRFYYRVQYRHGIVDSMRAVDVSFDNLKQALSAPVLEADWFGWYATSFSWDEKRFLCERLPGPGVPNTSSRFWTTSEAWKRAQDGERLSIQFVRLPGPAGLWKTLTLFDFSYLRLTPHRYWWGQTVHLDQTMSCVSPERGNWRHLGRETLGAEDCDVVVSTLRGQQLWIGQRSGRVRGVLSYRVEPDSAKAGMFFKTDLVQRIADKRFSSQAEYARWYTTEANEDQLRQISLAWAECCQPLDPSRMRLNEWIQLDDYRQVASGLWLPFREVRTISRPSEIARNKRSLTRSELRVEEVRTDMSLAGRYAELLPKEGARIQDQRFIVAVNYLYRSALTDEEIRKIADTEYQKLLKDQEYVTRLVQPLEVMIGKPAPALSAGTWIGGSRPSLAGRPYLLHFWHTRCGPCKSDFPRLKTLAERGAIIIGVHTSGTSSNDVEKVVREYHLNYPTFLASDNNPDGRSPRVGAYPAGIAPYCILVDAQGRVSGHGFLFEVSVEALFTARRGELPAESGNVRQ
jgi:thiol-disulfide isomerase/thioredoxin